jgi:hypothetical protein
MGSMKRPKKRSEAYRVVCDTLATVSKKLHLPKGAFDPLANEIMAKMYPPKKKATKGTKSA